MLVVVPWRSVASLKWRKRLRKRPIFLGFPPFGERNVLWLAEEEEGQSMQQQYNVSARTLM